MSRHAATAAFVILSLATATLVGWQFARDEVSLPDAALAAGIDPEALVPIDHWTAGAVRVGVDYQVELILFTRDDAGWSQAGSAFADAHNEEMQLGLVGWGEANRERTVLFGAGPHDVAGVTAFGTRFSFGMSDVATGTWLLAAPIEDGAALQWTAWSADHRQLATGHGLVIIGH